MPEKCLRLKKTRLKRDLNATETREKCQKSHFATETFLGWQHYLLTLLMMIPRTYNYSYDNLR